MRAWKPRVAGIREVFHARFTDHAYPRHTHDVWTLFIVDDGAIRYELDRHQRGAERSMVSILPPHVVHDGRPATAAGFRKRVLYVESSVLGEQLIGPAVDRPELHVEGLRAHVAALHDTLECADDALEAEVRFASIAERIAASLGSPPPTLSTMSRADQAEQLRALLDEHLFESMTMASAAAAIGVSPAQLARSFSEAFGIAPHAYVLGRRLEAARDRVLGGQPLADVAAEVGFYDQAHLTRHFKRYLGTSPSRFRAGTVPS